MKKKVLLVRSVSFQQLDKNLNGIVALFSTDEYEFHLLTHGHGLQRAATYGAVSRIIDYGSRGNFSFFHFPSGLERAASRGVAESYDMVIVPVTNISGVGFLNVLAMALRLPARKIYVCNLVSEIFPLSRSRIVVRLARSMLTMVFSALATLTAALLLAGAALPLMAVTKGSRVAGKKKGGDF